MQEDQLTGLYRQRFGTAPQSVDRLAGAGSNRQYFRLGDADGSTVIGVVGTSARENHTFLYMSRHFRQRGLPVPEILAESADSICYLQEDLGSTSLFDAIADGRQSGWFSDGEKQLLSKTVRLLPRIQFEGAEGMDFSQCFQQPAFDRRSVLWDLNYFKYCFLKATGLSFSESRLEDDFQHMADTLLAEDYTGFMYRDFQSRNVMLRGGEPWLIDYQGGYRGPHYYDVASFLWQAKANLPDGLRQELVGEYIDALKRYKEVDAAHFRRMLAHFVLFRTLQVLGAYGFRGWFERKPHFIESIPYAIGNLRQLLSQNAYDEYPYLQGLLQQLTELPLDRNNGHSRPLPIRANEPTKPIKPAGSRLIVTVMSFGYRKGGIPADPTGNGGGFVFDCRAITNPGRLEQFRQMNGLDQPVIDFLEATGEVQPFLQHAYALVDASVRRYQQRGFTSLMVCFGCTGGQHRSVYSAQHMAEHINKVFGVEVHVVHREQGISQILKPIDL